MIKMKDIKERKQIAHNTMNLKVGNMNYISGEMEWLKTHMQAHDHPASELVHFMQSYAKATDRHINGSGRPIIDRLSLESAKPAF